MIAVNWFNEVNKQNLERIIKENDIKTVLEIGSFLGESAIWFANRVDKVYCLDPFKEAEDTGNINNLVDTLSVLNLNKDFYQQFLDNIKEAGVEDKIEVLRGYSKDFIESAPEVDLIYVDGDHSPEGVRFDVENYVNKAKKVICGDDHTDRFPGILELVKEKGFQSDGPFWYHIK